LIESFRVGNEKVIDLAECTKVPRIMIVAGPNGIGKSTLLYALRSRKGVTGAGKILYIPPHRAWFRQKIRAMYLWGKNMKYGDFLSSDRIPGVEGLNLRGLSRTYDSLDEAPSTIKHILGQLETRRREVITRVFDQTGSVDKDKMPDVYEPLRKLISFFLPHLQFSHIDFAARDDVRCIFKNIYQISKGSPLEIDIDDLSSGEREVITLFLNFIEKRIGERLSTLEGATLETPQDLILVIDSPELHLHPALQQRFLDYIRDVVAGDNVQFIMATHSQTLVNAARFDELYVLVPPQKMRGYNQLVKVSNEATRLETIRELAGETYSLTLGKPLIFIEGRPPGQGLKEPSDKRILEMILPDFASYTLVPFHDRQRICALIRELSASTELTPLGLCVFAILDNDRAAEQSERDVDRIFAWPVCSIENFLLDSQAIWDTVQPQRERLSWKGPDEVTLALKEIALGLKDAEVKLRAEEKLGCFRWHLEANSDTGIEDSFEEGERKYKEFYGDKEKRRTAYESAKQEVDEIITSDKIFQSFRGKEILRRFHMKFVAGLGIGYQTFVYQIAERIGRRLSPPEILKVKAHIDGFVPWSLPTTLQALLTDLQTNKESLSIPQDLLTTLTEAKSEADKAVEEAKKWTELIIDRNALKEKCWTTLFTLRQHIASKPTSSLTEQVVRNVDAAAAKTAAIITGQPSFSQRQETGTIARGS
jgi:hypothetical protein